MKFESEELSEAIFRYMSQPDKYKAFVEVCQTEDISLAEYVYNYSLNDFKEFCIVQYGITVEI